MSKKTVEDSSLISVADAIREKGGTDTDLVFPSGFIEAINNLSGDIPEGYIKPIGNLTDSLITRASWTGAHKATLPEGYYVNTPINISEWKSGQITGNNTSGGTFNIPFSSIGFVPTWAVICLNTGISNYSANIVLSYFSTSSAAGCIYTGSSSLSSNSYVLKTGGALATFNDNGVTFPAISGVKYLNKSYRWFAMR